MSSFIRAFLVFFLIWVGVFKHLFCSEQCQRFSGWVSVWLFGKRESESKVKMTLDRRQVITAILTLSMFAMLGNMIKKRPLWYVSSKFTPCSPVCFPRKLRNCCVGFHRKWVSVAFVFWGSVIVNLSLSYQTKH